MGNGSELPKGAVRQGGKEELRASVLKTYLLRIRAEKGEREGRLRRMTRFLREVRAELKKVAWPSRQEVFTYTVVVLVSVTFVTLLTFGLDYLFGKGVLTFFKG